MFLINLMLSTIIWVTSFLLTLRLRQTNLPLSVVVIDCVCCYWLRLLLLIVFVVIDCVCCYWLRLLLLIAFVVAVVCWCFHLNINARLIAFVVAVVCGHHRQCGLQRSSAVCHCGLQRGVLQAGSAGLQHRHRQNTAAVQRPFPQGNHGM